MSVTIAVVLTTPTDYPPHLVAMAQNLDDAAKAYSNFAANSARDLFLNQDELGLSADDIKAAVAQIADEKAVITANNAAAFAVMSKNETAPTPPPPAPPAPPPAPPADTGTPVAPDAPAG